MDTLDVLLLIGLFLWLCSLPITGAWVVRKIFPPEKQYQEGWWKVRQKALLMFWGPPLVVVVVYLALKQLL
jgi:hypothetical protein